MKHKYRGTLYIPVIFLLFFATDIQAATKNIATTKRGYATNTGWEWLSSDMYVGCNDVPWPINNVLHRAFAWFDIPSEVSSGTISSAYISVQVKDISQWNDLLNWVELYDMGNLTWTQFSTTPSGHWKWLEGIDYLVSMPKPASGILIFWIYPSFFSNKSEAGFSFRASPEDPSGSIGDDTNYIILNDPILHITYTPYIPPPGGDSYEPDDTNSQANTISAGSPQNHSIEPASDMDWMNFSATNGTIYYLETFGSTDTKLYLYDTNGTTQIDWDDDSGNGTNAYIEWTCTSSGIYYVKVTGYSSSTTGSYTLSLTSTIPPPPPSPDDKYEENDTIGDAYDLSNHENTWLSNIDGPGIQADEDWYKIYVSSGYRRVLVVCLFTDSDGDIDIDLYDSSGTRLDYSDSKTDNEYIDYTVPSTGTYYIRIGYGDAGNSYDLKWNDELSDRITVTSPNGGEEWEQNTTYNITWNAVGDTGSYVKIELYSDGSSQTIISSTPNDGSDSSYLWEITPLYRTGTDYKILVISTSDIPYLDFSDDTFSIMPDPTNHCPVLSNGYVSPASGNPDTHFYWYVDYFDPDGDEPSTHHVVISADTGMVSMTLESGTPSNGTYVYGPRTLDEGSYSYYFYFYDGRGCSARLPVNDDEELFGPQINIPSLPNPPAWVDASDGTYQDKVVITWAVSDGATSYEVIRGTSSDGGGAVIGEPAETTYDDTTAEAETTYYYWVLAKNYRGSSGLSDYDTGYRSYGVPGIPQNLSASKGEYLDKVKVTFSRGTNAHSTMIYRNTIDDQDTATLIEPGTPWNYYDDSDTESGITYYYWVRGANYNGTSDFSDPDTGWVGITGAPDLVIQSITHTPQNLTIGSEISFTVTVQNVGSGDLGTGDASIFNVGFWLNLSISPHINDTPDLNKDISSLEAGDSKTLQFVVTAQSEGDKLAWAYADRHFNISEIDESNETNNVGPTGGYSWTVAETPDPPDPDPPGPEPGPCFIATAAYGSPLHPHLDTLRDFRDKYFMPTRFGHTLVELYYKYSPFVADLIGKHKALKIMVRINLLPLVVFSYSMLHFGPTITAFMLAFVFALPLFFVVFWRKRIIKEIKNNQY